MKKKISYIGFLLIAFCLLTSVSCRKPRILIIGDSISIGYTPFVQDYFSDRAIIIHNSGNAEHSGNGLLKIEEWLGDENWDIIQFNWGLWDLCYRNPESKNFGNRDKINGKCTNSLETYASNLDSIISIIKKKSNAKLIFVTTTYVPKNEPGRYENDVQKYNKAAKKVMKRHSIAINDIYKKSIAIHNSFGNGPDDVHYKKEGYKKLGELITNFIENQL